MDLLRTLLTAVAAGAKPGPFALLRRAEADHLDVLTGELEIVDRLADIPLPLGPAGPRTLSLVPFRQITERGFTCVDDAAPLECLRITGHQQVPLAAALADLPAAQAAVTGGRFDIDDEDYGAAVRTVLREEIGRGEGSNFVIHRVYLASVTGPPLVAGLAALRRLLTAERGAYWTFLVHTGNRILVGATPERHVSVGDEVVMMNPISGTHRHPAAGRDRAALLRFLADPKEIDELYMVLDEELKMMARVAEQGGRVVGPYLKEMAHLTHTEYLLAGRCTLDVREVLRETMFAPTVTGSPLENACRVIARHEGRGRRYYAGVLALLGHDDAGRQTLDAPILIRTAEISPAGEVRVPVGATLVRHSTATGEVAETYAKAAGVLAALGLHPGAPAAAAARQAPVRDRQLAPDPREPADGPRLANDPEVVAALRGRNTQLSGFWLEQSAPGALSVPALAGRRVLIVDGEDTFTGMLAHQLRGLGLGVTVRPWQETGATDGFDLVVPGPGPGDPADRGDAKMAALRGLVTHLLDRRHPMLAVCLGHQILAGLLGLTLHRRVLPHQGLACDIDLFGRRRRVGFYSTFTALAQADEIVTAYGTVHLARDADDQSVHALRGPMFAGLQFHPESVLSEDGLAILRDLLTELLDKPSRRL